MAEDDDPHRVYEKVVDIGGDCYFLEDDQTSLKMGCKSYVEFKKTFDPKLYNRSLNDIEYIFGRYLAFGNHQLDTFHGDDKDNLIQLLTTRIKQLKDSNEYSSSKIINSRMKTYVDKINAILAKLGEGEVVPNNVGKADTFSDEELYQFILELTWFMTHANKVPKQNRKVWNEMIKMMKDLKLGDIAQRIRQNNSNSKPPTVLNFFGENFNTNKLKNVKTLRQAVGESDDTIRPKFESLISLLRMKGYLGETNSYNVPMYNALSKKLLNPSVVHGPRARTGVRSRPASAPVSSKAKKAAVVPVLENDSESESNASVRTLSKAAKTSSSASSNLQHDTDSDGEIIDATGAAVASSKMVAAPATASKPISLQKSDDMSDETDAPSSKYPYTFSAINPKSSFSFNLQQKPAASQGQSANPTTFSFQGGGESTTESLKNDTLTTDTLYQLTSPLFDYIRVLFDPIYSILQRPEFEMDITLITIIPLLHVCMNIKLPGIYRIVNIDPEVKTCIDKMLGSTQQYLSTLTKPESKKQFLEQLRILPRIHLTSLLGPSSNSNHYKDPSTLPSIQFLSLGVNFTVKEEATNVPDGFFDENNLYLSNTPETSTTDKLKGLFSSNSNKKIKLYTLDWNTINASKASLDLQNDKKEINGDSLDINPEVLFTDSELFLKTIMIVHHIFPGKNTFTPIEQPKPKAKPEPKEEDPKEEEDAESNENNVPKEVVSPNTVPQTNAPLALTTNAVPITNTVPQTNAPIALTTNAVVTPTNAVPQTNAPTTNAVVVPTNAVPQTNALTTNTTVVAPTTNTTVAPTTNTTAIVVSK